MTTTETATATNRARLFEVASEQGGYFTAAQARSARLQQGATRPSRQIRSLHPSASGALPISRIPEFTARRRIAAWLATGKEVAAVSHDSALDILGLSDAVPEVVHLTVPRTKRYRSRFPGIAIHTTTRRLGKSDVVVRDGIRVTAAARSIIDAAETGTAPEQITAAVGQALDRGMATKSKLLAVAKARGGRVEHLVRQVLEERRRK